MNGGITLLNFRKEKLKRTISLVASLSVFVTVFAGINASAETEAVTNQSFYENFEGYGDVSYDTYANDNAFAGGWKVRNAVGSSGNITGIDLSTVDTGSVKSGKAFKLGIDVTDVAGPSLYINPDITIGKEDIIISGDVYIPETNIMDAKQYVRFFVSRGNSTTDAAASNGWTSYNPAVSPAFGLFFYNRDDLDPANVWKVCIGAPRKDSAGFEYNSTATSNFTVTPDTWYNLCYIYHPSTGEVDYYIDGKYLDSHPVGQAWTGTSASGTYTIPNLAPGKPLGNINIMGGGYQSAETAAMFDNILVVTVSAADEVKFSEVGNGTDYIFANWDIPVDKNTINNVTVKKMAEDDITFSGVGATDADCNVEYKASNGVGISFDTPLTENFARYQVKVTGATDIYGKTVNRAYNFVVKNVASQKGEAFTDDFTSDKGWISSSDANLDVSLDTTENQLVADAMVGYYVLKSPKNMNLPVDNSIEYVQLDFDMKAVEQNDADEFEAYVKLVDENGAYAAGILINQANIKPITKGGARIDRPNASNADMLDVWKSYRLRYYPWQGKMEVYAGDTQQTISDQPVLTSLTYLNHDGQPQRSGTDPYTWTRAGFGSKITGFDIQLGKVSTTYLDNVKASSWGYDASRRQMANFSDSFDTGIEKWTTINSATSTTAIDYVSGDYEGKTNVLKGSTGTTAYGQFLSGKDTENQPFVNIPINENVEYIDADFDLRAEASGNTTWQTYIMFAESNTTTRHTGISIESAAAATAIAPVSRNGKMISASKVVSTEVITRNVWTNYKLRYYPNKGELEVYVNGSETPFYKGLTYADRETDNTGKTPITWNTTTHGSGVGGINIQTITPNTDTYIDNLSITSYSYPERSTTVKAATFETAKGSMLDNKAGAKTSKIYFDNATTEPTVMLNGFLVSGTFDAANGVYTVILDDMLVGHTNYSLTINGRDYVFTTGDGEYKVSDLRFEKANVPVSQLTNDDVIQAKVGIFNSTENSETPYLIWVAYNGSEVKYIDLKPIYATAGYDDTAIGQNLTVTGDYTTVKAFLWDGFATLVELTDECILTRPAAN